MADKLIGHMGEVLDKRSSKPGIGAKGSAGLLSPYEFDIKAPVKKESKADKLIGHVRGALTKMGEVLDKHSSKPGKGAKGSTWLLSPYEFDIKAPVYKKEHYADQDALLLHGHVTVHEDKHLE
eukprot:1422058-Rhodomonas_salina.1